MPRKIEEDDFEMEDEDDEEEEEMPMPKRIKTRGPGRPRKNPPKEEEEPEEEEERPKEVTERFEVFHQPEVIGVRETETGTVIAQGFTNVGEAIAFSSSKNDLEEIKDMLGRI